VALRPRDAAYRLARSSRAWGSSAESTQWEVMQPLVQSAQPILDALIAQAAQSPLIHHDDTTMRILDLRRPAAPPRPRWTRTPG
jgi:hypothetical protein